ncbi:hypothetical protein NPIL_305521 [Nephila pilipes]|uniref:Uncharacterized protein n=1 Tax=Nephila pilipes TaxID=299642 RepID=A0A8X6TEX2_NEPPI|nr:hypothetical protein NPIL_305521 [Nephila pilipes]
MRVYPRTIPEERFRFPIRSIKAPAQCREFSMRNITDSARQLYLAYFGMKLPDQDKSWALHKVCVHCLNDLHFCLKGKKTALRLRIHVTWMEPEENALMIVTFVPAISVSNTSQIKS